jgi:hypothetical protein
MVALMGYDAYVSVERFVFEEANRRQLVEQHVVVLNRGALMVQEENPR